VALGLLPFSYSPNTRWCFGLGTHRHDPTLALGLVGQDQNRIGSWPRADRAPHGAWAAQRHLALGLLPLGCSLSAT